MAVVVKKRNPKNNLLHDRCNCKNYLCYGFLFDKLVLTHLVRSFRARFNAVSDTAVFGSLPVDSSLVAFSMIVSARFNNRSNAEPWIDAK